MYSQKNNIVKNDLSEKMDDSNTWFHLCTFGCGSGKTTNFLYECADRIKNGKPFAYKDKEELNVALFSANTVSALRSNMATLKKRLNSDYLFNEHVAILPGYQDIARSFLKQKTKKQINNLNEIAKQTNKYNYTKIADFINRYTKNPTTEDDPIRSANSVVFNLDFIGLMAEVKKLINAATKFPKAEKDIQILKQTDFYKEATAADNIFEKNHKKIIFLTHKKLTINLFRSFFGDNGRMSLVGTFVCIDEFELFHQTWVSGISNITPYDIHRVSQKIAATSQKYGGFKLQTEEYKKEFNNFYEKYLQPHLEKVDVFKNISIQSIQKNIENLHLLSFSNILTSNKSYRVSDLALVSNEDNQYDLMRSEDKESLGVFDYLFSSLDLVNEYRKAVNNAVKHFMQNKKRPNTEKEELINNIYKNHYLEKELIFQYFRIFNQKKSCTKYRYTSDFNHSGLRLVSFEISSEKSPEDNATNFSQIHVPISASGWFVDFVKENKVMALSATGKNQSIKNFNLNFIQDELGNKSLITSNQKLDEFKRLNKRNFSCIEFNVNTIHLAEPSDYVLEQLCIKLNYKNHNELSQELQSVYLTKWLFKATELLQLTASVENFCKLKDHQHGLCILNSCYVGKPKIVDRLKNIAIKHNVIIYVLNAENFKKTEPKILESINSGLRCLRIMNYSSGGAGASMQTKLHPEYSKHIKQIGQKRHKNENEVDISYLFLQHYRNAIQHKTPKNPEQQIQMAYQIADLHNRGVIKDPNKTYQNLFFYKKENKSLYEEYEESSDYLTNYAQKIEQAVGRIDRVNNKHKSIVIDVCSKAESILMRCDFDHRSSSDVALLMLKEIKNKQPNHWINKQNTELTDKLNESAEIHLRSLRQSRNSSKNQDKHIARIKYLKENITTDNPKKEYENHYIKNKNLFFLENPKHKYYAFDKPINHPKLSENPVKEYRLNSSHIQKIAHRIARTGFNGLDKTQTSNFDNGAYRICPHSATLVFNMMAEDLFKKYCACLNISYIHNKLPYEIHERCDLIGIEGNFIIAVDIKNSQNNRFEYFSSDKNKKEISFKRKEINSYYRHIKKDKDDKNFKLIYLILNTYSCNNSAPIQEIYKDTFYCDGFLLQNESLNNELFSSLSKINTW